MRYEEMPREQLLALLKERTDQLEVVSEELQREITERRQAERSLYEQLHFMQRLIDTISSPVFYKETDGIFLGCNIAYENYIGLTKDQIVGKTVFEVYPDDLAKIYYEKDRSLFHNPGLQVYDSSFRVADGSRRDTIFNKATYTNTEGVLAGLVGVIADITELKRAGEDLRKSNILYEALLKALPVGLLQLDTAGLCVKIIEPKKHNINSIIKTISPLIQADALKGDKNVNLELGDIPALLLDEKEMRQLILNLALNGFEAMSPGGDLTISTFMEGDQVVLAVKDSGRGISPEIPEKIGTPFLTTKEDGTGLGLAVCYSIAARHSASIQIDTSPGGTVFNVRFKQQNN